MTWDRKGKTVSYPFHLRIPEWCKKATIPINGKVHQESEVNQIVQVNRAWNSGVVVELQLPMHISTSRWYENSMAVERGPLT